MKELINSELGTKLGTNFGGGLKIMPLIVFSLY